MEEVIGKIIKEIVCENGDCLNKRIKVLPLIGLLTGCLRSKTRSSSGSTLRASMMAVVTDTNIHEFYEKS